MRPSIALAVFLLTAVSAAAQLISYERFVIRVFPVTSTTFEVLLDDFAGPTQMWCAAATYAERALGKQGGDLWLKTPLAPSAAVPNRRGLVFSIEPVVPEVKSFSFSMRTAGVRRSMASASSVCSENRSEVFVRLPNGRLLRAY
ncbi:MAG: hypothetical protein AB3N22_19320 [Ruegeria sp.]